MFVPAITAPVAVPEIASSSPVVRPTAIFAEAESNWLSSGSKTLMALLTSIAVLFSVQATVLMPGGSDGASLTAVIVIVPVNWVLNAVVNEAPSLVLAPSLSVTEKLRVGAVVLTVGSSLLRL